MRLSCAMGLALSCSAESAERTPSDDAAGGPELGAAGQPEQNDDGLSSTLPADGAGDIIIDSEPNEVLPAEIEMAVGSGEGDECVDASSTSTAAPVTVFVALDRSTSMLTDDRWLAVTEALRSFYGDPSSAGLVASLQVFPFDGSDKESGCVPGSYDSPDVPLTELPNEAPFAAFLETTMPGGWTPTSVVAAGLIAQADAVLTADPASRVAIVLVNDGEPLGCEPYGDHTIPKVAELLAAAADRMPTYVIGIGSELEDLHALAEAGGTGSAVLVESTDPAAARLDVLARLNSIRSEIAVCDLPIPTPPEGRTLDPFKVTTEIQDAAGNATPVPYENNCETGAGWHYDDLDAPTQISLCPQACEKMREQGQSGLSVVFGCKVNPVIMRVR